MIEALSMNPQVSEPLWRISEDLSVLKSSAYVHACLWHKICSEQLSPRLLDTDTATEESNNEDAF